MAFHVHDVYNRCLEVNMLFNPSEAVFARAMADLALANPFDPQQVSHHEALALAVDLPDEIKQRTAPVQPITERIAERHNISELLPRTLALAEVVRERLRFADANDAERTLYRDVVLFVLYFRFRERLQRTVEQTLHEPVSGPEARSRRRGGTRISYYEDFVRDLDEFLRPAGGAPAKLVAHWFAGFFQIRRAFQLIHAHILGASRPGKALRTAVWQSIFTHDMRRYRD